jgi:hypothetical protein
VKSYHRAMFRVKAAIKIAPERETDRVLSDAQLALQKAFGFAERDFGQTVSVDEVAAVLHGVAGVEAAHITYLYRLDNGATPKLEPRLFAALPVASLSVEPMPAELLLLNDKVSTVEVLP